MNDATLIASAGVDLYNRAKLPANEEAASTAIAEHVAAYLAGDVWFPILSGAQADALFQRDDVQLGGLGSALKKAVKKVHKTVKKVVKKVDPITGQLHKIDPMGGMVDAALGLGPKPPATAETLPATSLTAPSTATVVPKPAMTANDQIMKYAPYALGAVLLLMLVRQ